MKRIFKQGIFAVAALAAVILTKQTVFADPVLVNSKNFPDKAFREAIVRTGHYAYDESGQIMKDSKGNYYVESDNIQDLYCNKTNNVKGIEYFPKLQTVDIYEFKGKTIDLTGNPKITRIGIEGQNLTTLKLANYNSVQSFYIKSSKLNFDFKKLKKVTNLCLDSDKISSFNATNYPNLTDLSITSNKLTKLDVSKSKKLVSLRLMDCKNVTDVNVGSLNTLQYLTLMGMPKLKSIDVSKCKNLINLSVTNSQINKIDIRKNAKLDSCSVNGNKKLTSIDLSKNPKLTYLNVGSTGIQKLNIDKNPKLYELRVYNTKISSLNLKKAKELEYINYTDSAIKTLPLNKLYKQLTITYSDIAPGSSVNLSNFIGTGYKTKDNLANQNISYDSKKSVIKPKKNKKVYGAYLTLTKGNRTYNIRINYKY